MVVAEAICGGSVVWGGVQCFQLSGGGTPVEAGGSTPWLRLRVCLIPEGQGTTGPRAGLEYSYSHQWRESAAWLEWTELTGAVETPAGGLKGPAHVGLRPCGSLWLSHGICECMSW